MFCETNPVPIKYALTLAHRYKSSEVRLPLTELTDANKEKVQTSVKPLFEEVLKEFFAD